MLMKLRFLIIFLMCLESYACHNVQSKVSKPEVVPVKIEYNLNRPDKHTVLPDALHEVSDIAYLGDSTLACIQDEKGIIFLYDLKKNLVTHSYKFGKDGDYE